MVGMTSALEHPKYPERVPTPLYTQTVIAFIWDFDRTLIPGNQQEPIFEEYGVEESEFWAEVEGLADFYEKRGVLIGRDAAYLHHMITYVEQGIFKDLDNAKLVESPVVLLPGRIRRAPLRCIWCHILGSGI